MQKQQRGCEHHRINNVVGTAGTKLGICEILLKIPLSNVSVEKFRVQESIEIWEYNNVEIMESLRVCNFKLTTKMSLPFAA